MTNQVILEGWLGEDPEATVTMRHEIEVKSWINWEGKGLGHESCSIVAYAGVAREIMMGTVGGGRALRARCNNFGLTRPAKAAWSALEKSATKLLADF